MRIHSGSTLRNQLDSFHSQYEWMWPRIPVKTQPFCSVRKEHWHWDNEASTILGLSVGIRVKETYSSRSSLLAADLMLVVMSARLCVLRRNLKRGCRRGSVLLWSPELAWFCPEQIEAWSVPHANDCVSSFCFVATKERCLRDFETARMGRVPAASSRRTMRRRRTSWQSCQTNTSRESPAKTKVKSFTISSRQRRRSVIHTGCSGQCSAETDSCGRRLSQPYVNPRFLQEVRSSIWRHVAFGPWRILLLTEQPSSA